MKILKERSRSYKGINYYKYKINIPESKLMASGFKEGNELECEAEKRDNQVKIEEKISLETSKAELMVLVRTFVK